MPKTFIHIKSEKFPVLPGEEDELVNEGTYGKALALYLEEQLKKRGYEVPFVCCEDWGWWVEIKGQPYSLGLCVYGASGVADFNGLCVTMSRESGKSWSWSRFWFIDNRKRIETLFDDVDRILRDDPEIQVIGHTKDCPIF